MLKREFDALCKRNVSDEDYKLIEFVYNYYPCNFDHQAIAHLVSEFGMTIIYDLLPRAQAAMEHEMRIERLRIESIKAKELLEEAKSVDVYSKEFVTVEDFNHT